jgi:hypothetical protein
VRLAGEKGEGKGEGRGKGGKAEQPTSVAAR